MYWARAKRLLPTMILTSHKPPIVCESRGQRLSAFKYRLRFAPKCQDLPCFGSVPANGQATGTSGIDGDGKPIISGFNKNPAGAGFMCWLRGHALDDVTVQPLWRHGHPVQRALMAIETNQLKNAYKSDNPYRGSRCKVLQRN